MNNTINLLKKQGWILFILLLSHAINATANEFNTTHQAQNVPGDSVANSTPIFMKRFRKMLVEYSQRAHQCSNPSVIETQVMFFSPIDTTESIPLLTGPIHEQWKILACGNKFYYFVGVAPDERDHNLLVFATVFKESDW